MLKQRPPLSLTTPLLLLINPRTPQGRHPVPLCLTTVYHCAILNLMEWLYWLGFALTPLFTHKRIYRLVRDELCVMGNTTGLAAFTSIVFTLCLFWPLALAGLLLVEVWHWLTE